MQPMAAGKYHALVGPALAPVLRVGDADERGSVFGESAPVEGRRRPHSFVISGAYGARYFVKDSWSKFDHVFPDVDFHDVVAIFFEAGHDSSNREDR